MAFPISSGDIVQVRTVCRANDQVGLNIRHYRAGAVTSGSSVDQTEIAAAISALIRTPYKAVLSANARWEGVGVRRIKPLPLTQESFDNTGNAAGTVAGDVLPRQVAGIVTLQTSFAGRKFRGRMYLPFPSEGDNDTAGIPSNSYVANALAIGAIFATFFVVTGVLGTIQFDPILFHRATGTFDGITDAVARQRWATQRRRGSYGAQNVFP